MKLFSLLTFFCLIISSPARPEESQRPRNAPRFSITELRKLPDAMEALPFGINDAGVVVGYGERWIKKSPTSEPERTWENQGFWWQAGKVSRIELDLRGGEINAVRGVNGKGQVIGQSGLHSFVWQKGVFRLLTPLREDAPWSDVYGINNRGHVVGESSVDSRLQSIKHAVVWRDGKAEDLGLLPGCRVSRALSINDQDQIVGVAFTKDVDIDPENVSHAFLWQNGQLQELPTSGGKSASATAINNQGQAAGWSDPKPDETTAHIRRAVLWQNDKVIELGALPQYKDWRNTKQEQGSGGIWGGQSYTTEARGINDRGQVVGNALIQSGCVGWSEAFFWEKGIMYDLETLLPADSGWELRSAESINSKGQIIGVGSNNGERAAYLLTPLDKP